MNKLKARRAKNRMHNLVVGIGATAFFIILIVYGIKMGVADAADHLNQKGKEQVMEITLTKTNFEMEVLKSDKPVLVDFWAPWCGPCRMLAPVLAEVAEEKAGTIKVGKVNVDEEPDLAAQYGISGIPAMLLFKDGKVAATSVGFMPKHELEAFIAMYVAK